MDTIQECLIVKSGMYIDYGEIKNILEDLKDDLSKFLFNSGEAQFYRLRPEEIEYVINNIRQNIGELPDNNHFSIMSLLIKYHEFQDEMMRAVKKLTPCMDWHIKAYGSEKPFGDEFINKLIQESGILKRVAELVFLTIFNSLDRSFSYLQPTKNWNGIVGYPIYSIVKSCLLYPISILIKDILTTYQIILMIYIELIGDNLRD